jgi:hypothetical protein
MRNLTRAALAAAAAVALLAGCTSEADTVGHNIDKEAEDFKVNRRIVFFNGITDTYMLTIEGACSITDEGNQLEVLCKIDKGDGAGSYKNHLLGLSDNVTYFVEQLDAVDVDAYHYEVNFRPETIVPDVDLETSGEGN